MISVSRLMFRIGASALLAASMTLAGCHTGLKGDVVSTQQMKGSFDVTVESYKSGQFLLDGAVLSAADLGSHFAYLKDQGQLPSKVLLERSDDSKIRKSHLEFMARMALDNGFTVYYDHDGELRQINAVEDNARPLEDYKARPKTDNDPMRGKDASSGAYDPNYDQH